MVLGIGIALTAMLIGMIVVAIRSGRSWLAMVLPLFSYYTRTRIARWSIRLSIIVTILNALLVAIIIYKGYNVMSSSLINLDNDFISYIPMFTTIGSDAGRVIIIRAILQIWVNRGVAYQRGRGLYTGIELTFLGVIFWPLLAVSSKIKKSHSE